jgi:hypothetical protein
MPKMPATASDTIGYTFRGRVNDVRTDRIFTPDSAEMTVTFDVEVVYAESRRGLVEGQRLELHSTPCDGFALLGLQELDQILFSTRELQGQDGAGPRVWDTAIWRIESGSLGLLVLGPPDEVDDFDPWQSDDRRIARVHTIDEALALVIPNAPSTDTLPAMPARPEPPMGLVAMGVAALLVGLHRFSVRCPSTNSNPATGESGRGDARGA